MKKAILFFGLLRFIAGAGELPELMRADSGITVDSAQLWEDIRRPEILQTFTTNVFGVRSVERPDTLTFEQAGADRTMIGGRAVRKLIDIRYTGAGGEGCIRVNAFIPIRSTPAPGFLLICNRDPAENIDPERNRKSPFWPVEEIIARGYAALAFYNGDVCPDRNTGFTVGVHSIFEPDPSVRTEESWATISAWAWGASRVMDWIVTEPLLDAAHIAVIGHSRGGKTALWCGATDPRFAYAISSCSGCSGAKLNHMDLPSSESIASITKSFPYWFCTRYNSYAGKEMEMPFDQHELLALIAPRLLAVGSATLDNWAGQKGEFASTVHASPAWGLYGKSGMVGTEFPPAERPMQDGCISYHLRVGSHNLLLYDWNRYMDFADRHGWCLTPVSDNGLAFDTTGGDQTCSTNLVTPGALFKFGPNTLRLTGTNTIGGDIVVCDGTLSADWGAGIDTNRAIRLRGGCLSNPTGRIKCQLGNEAGQISIAPGMAAGFTAKGVPLSVRLGQTDDPIVWGSEEFSPSPLILNSAEADAPLVFESALDVNGCAAVIHAVSNNVSLCGAITDSAGTGQLNITGGSVSLCAPGTFRLLQIANGGGVLTVTNPAALTVNQIVVSNGTMCVAESASVRATSGGDAIKIGTGDSAEFDLDGGVVSCGYHFQLGLSKGTGVFRQMAGENTVYGVTSIGHDANSYGNAYVSGGVWSQPVAKNFRVGEWGNGYLEVSGTGTVRCGTLALNLAEYASGSGRVVLRQGGVIEAPKVIGGAGVKREWLFDGGLLRATASLDRYLSGLTSFAMGKGGGIIDTDGHDITLAQPLTENLSNLEMDETLVHRWSFNGDLQDSVGGGSATAVGNVTFADGCARLSGGTFGTSYLNLGKDVLPKNGKAVTLEIWATQRAIQDWSRIFDFGKGNANANYITMTWTKGSDLQTDMIRIFNGAASQSNYLAPYELGKEYHIAFVLEPISTGGWLATAYKQDAVTGVTEARHSFTNANWSLTGQDLDTCYLGHSRQSANHDAAADYNEVRVWNRALTESELIASVGLGADYSPQTQETRVFEKRGKGMLTLTGQNCYPVDTVVAGGTLALASESSLPEDRSVSLAAGAVLNLGGNAQTLVNLNGNGTVSEGTLTVTGSVNPGSDPGASALLEFSKVKLSGAMELDVSVDGTVDRVRCVEGPFELSGLTLKVNGLSRLARRSYPIVISADGIAGTFSDTNFAGTPWTLVYKSDQVLLVHKNTLLMIK